MLKIMLRIAGVLIVPALSVSALAADPVLVKDININATGTVVKDSFPANLLTLGGSTYFSATTALTGNELYVTNGTSVGTSLLKDIRAGSASSSPGGLTMIDATRFVFSADDGTNGRELWVSDGTQAGTQLLKDINTTAGSGSNPSYLTSIGGGIVVFWASDGSTGGAQGTEVWRTNGTSGGTYRISDIAFGTNSAIPQVPGFIAFGGKVFFAAQDLAGNSELYSSDGTNLSSTVLVKEINGDPLWGSSPREFAVLSPTQLLFRAFHPTSGDELWITNGTTVGTTLVKDIVAGAGGSTLTGLTTYNGKVYFSAYGGASVGRELFSSDGTESGTVMLADLYAGRLSSNPRYLTVCNGKLCFNAQDSIHGSELFLSNGTASGTVAVDSVAGIGGLNPWNLSTVNFAGVGERLLFQGFHYESGATSKPWISDGTANGTGVLKDIFQGNTGFISVKYTAFAGGALFSATDGSPIGRELWKTDGTNAGTLLVADIAQPTGTADSNPTNLAAVGGTLFFQANDGSTNHGTELWKSDGTSGGTELVFDIATGTGGSNPQNLVDGGGLLFFQANNGSTNQGSELWKSDGTSGGTTMVRDINPGTAGSSPSSLVYNGSVVVFAANDGTNGTELWSSDGTFANTSMVADLNPGSNSSSPSNLFRNGSDIYMAAAGPDGSELYRYRNGSLDLVADINLAGGSFPGPMVKLGNYLLYRATDGINGTELWRTDLNTDVTTNVADINAGPGNSNPQLMVTAGSMAFFVATDGVHGFELFATDGNANTAMVKDINPAGTSSGVLGSSLAAIGNKVVFGANDGLNGFEPWVSDGTELGTFMLKDIAPASAVAPFGSGLSTNPVFYHVNGTIYFKANDGIQVHGEELWKTDGTIAGTVLVADINIGAGTAGYGSPANFLAIGNNLFFSASDGAALHGKELFLLSVAP